MIGALNEAMQFHSTALRLRSERQQVLASNIANADTPGYKARDFDFAGSLSAAMSGAAPQSSGLAATAAGHIAPARSSLPPPTLQYRSPRSTATVSKWMPSVPISPTTPCATKPRFDCLTARSSRS
jgi:flagellar basal-body rod protein FlgB